MFNPLLVLIAMATQKTVTVIGYSTDESQSERAFAHALDPRGRDLFEQEEKTNTKQYIRWTDDEGEEQEKFIREDLFDAIKESGAFDPENERVQVVEETTTEMKYTTRLYSVGNSVKSEVCEHMPDEIDGLTKGIWTRKWQNEQGETQIEVIGNGLTSERVMAHQATRNAGQRFETEDERPCVKLQVEMNGTDEEVESWSEDVVPQIVEGLSDFDAVGKVRITDCKTRIEKEGDCFNL